jgi:hypothetical protein
LLGFDVVALCALRVKPMINRQAEIIDGPGDRDNAGL